MTNPFLYYTYTEILYALLSLLVIAFILVGYSMYYLKKQAGYFLLLTLLSPITIAALIFLFSKSLSVDPGSFNAIAILWFPLLFSLSHTLYYITRLKRSYSTNTFEFDFLKEIRNGNIAIAMILLTVCATTVAILPTTSLVAVGIGLVNILITLLVNTFIIIKRI